jgi:hypothetical protein
MTRIYACAICFNTAALISIFDIDIRIPNCAFLQGKVFGRQQDWKEYAEVR